LVSVDEAIERVKRRHPEARLTKLPRHIEPYAKYMDTRRDKPASARDIAKAYIVTRSSVQRQAIGKPSICKVYPGYKPLPRSADPDRVRPEDVMAQLLFTPDGERFLDAAERGHFDAQSAGVLADRFACFGLVYPKAGSDLRKPATLRSNRALFAQDFKRAVRLASRSDEINDALKKPSKQYYTWMKENVFGIGASKAGFFASLLGRGDIPTFDAREIALWQQTPPWREVVRKNGKVVCARNKKTKKVIRDPETGACVPQMKKVGVLAPQWADVERLTQRFDEFPLELPPEWEPNRAHLLHHTLWDAYADGPKPTKTTHGTIIRAMQFAGPR